MKTLIRWINLSRWSEWAQSKLLYLISVVLLIGPLNLEALRLVAMAVTIACWAAFGYGINDIADQAADHRAEKPNRAASLSGGARALFLLLTAGGAFGGSLLWAEDGATPAFVAAGLALAAAYSLPPLRLKERGFLGLVAAAVAQWALPVLAVSAGEPRGWLSPAACALALLGLAIGMRWMGVHQLQDAAADRRAGVRTWTNEGGPAWALIVVAFSAEVVLVTVALAFTWPRSLPAVVALGGWIVAAEGPRLRQPLGLRLRTYAAAPLGEYYFLMFPGSLALFPPGSPGIAALVVLLGWGSVARIGDAWRHPRWRPHS